MSNNYIASVKSQIHELLQSIEKLPGSSNQSQIDELPQSIAPAGLSKDEILKMLVSIETAISDLNEAATERAKELEVVGNDYQKNLSKMIDDINQKYREQETLSEEIKNLECELASVISEQTSIKKQLEDSKLEYNQMQDEYNRKTQGLNTEDFKALIPVYGLYYAGKRAYEALDATVLSDLQANIQHKENEINTLESKIEEIKQSQEELSSRQVTLREEIKTLEQEKEQLEIKQKYEAKWVVDTKDILLNCQNIIKSHISKFKRDAEDASDTANDLGSCDEDLIEIKKSMEQLLDSISKLHIMVYNV